MSMLVRIIEDFQRRRLQFLRDLMIVRHFALVDLHLNGLEFTPFV